MQANMFMLTKQKGLATQDEHARREHVTYDPCEMGVSELFCKSISETMFCQKLRVLSRDSADKICDISLCTHSSAGQASQGCPLQRAILGSL